jgi:hypothetical protein
MRVADITIEGLYEGRGLRRLVVMIGFSRGRSRRSDLVHYGTPDGPIAVRITTREAFARWAIREAPAGTHCPHCWSSELHEGGCPVLRVQDHPCDHCGEEYAHEDGCPVAEAAGQPVGEART